jgi:hypothetical protein
MQQFQREGYSSKYCPGINRNLTSQPIRRPILSQRPGNTAQRMSGVQDFANMTARIV